MCLRKLLWALLFAAFAGSYAHAEDAVSVTLVSFSDVQQVQRGEVLVNTMPIQSSFVASQVAGKVTSVLVEEGTTVESGSALVEVDCTDISLQADQLKANKERVKAQLALAKRQADRARSLKDFASNELLMQRETDTAVFEAELKSINVQEKQFKIQLDRCSISAPFAGVVHDVHVEQGEWINIGQGVVNLVNITETEAQAMLTPSQLKEIRSAAKLGLEIDSQFIPVKIRSVAPKANENNTVNVFLTVAGSALFIPGTKAKLTWEFQRPLLPPDYLVSRKGKTGVFIAENGKANFVVLDQAREGKATMVNFDANTQLINNGRFIVKDGQPISTAK